MFDVLKSSGFDVLALHHAEAVLRHDMPEAIEDIQTVLADLEIPIAEIVGGGGGEAKSTQRMRKHFATLEWKKRTIEIKKIVDGRERASLTHEIDHVKEFGEYLIALEIEWNNKDPFFDRDLENFKRLHAEGAISLGVIITRGLSLHAGIRSTLLDFANVLGINSLGDLEHFGYSPTQRQRNDIERRMKSGDISFAQAWVSSFVSDKFGEATTHWSKLDDRVRRGVGNPCPLLLIGIPISVVRQ